MYGMGTLRHWKQLCSMKFYDYYACVFCLGILFQFSSFHPHATWTSCSWQQQQRQQRKETNLNFFGPLFDSEKRRRVLKKRWHDQNQFTHALLLSWIEHLNWEYAVESNCESNRETGGYGRKGSDLIVLCIFFFFHFSFQFSQFSGIRSKALKVLGMSI